MEQDTRGASEWAKLVKGNVFRHVRHLVRLTGRPHVGQAKHGDNYLPATDQESVVYQGGELGCGTFTPRRYRSFIIAKNINAGGKTHVSSASRRNSVKSAASILWKPKLNPGSGVISSTVVGWMGTPPLGPDDWQKVDTLYKHARVASYQSRYRNN